jgi:2'-5' RNA ligase
MSWLIVAPFEAAPIDLGRIETLRRRHDPHHAIIPAHVTLVFPFEPQDPDAIRDHFAAVAAGQVRIRCRLAAYLAVRDHEDRASHVFMVPDTGRAEIEDLHDRLYAGPLAPHLRLDIPFIPHVTVAAFEHHDQAEDLVRELGRVGVSGWLNRLELMEFEDGRVSPLAQIDLLG